MKTFTAIFLAVAFALASGCGRPEESNLQSTIEALVQRLGVGPR